MAEPFTRAILERGWQFPVEKPSFCKIKVQETTVVQPSHFPGDSGSARHRYERILADARELTHGDAVDRNDALRIASARATVSMPSVIEQNDEEDNPRPPKIARPNETIELAHTVGSKPLVTGPPSAQLQGAGIQPAWIQQSKIPPPPPTKGYSVFSMDHTPGLTETCRLVARDDRRRAAIVHDSSYPDTSTVCEIPTTTGSTRRAPKFFSLCLFDMVPTDSHGDTPTLMLLDGVFENILAPSAGRRSLEKMFPPARIRLKFDVCISEHMVNTVLTLVNLEMSVLNPDGTAEFTHDAIERLKKLAIKQLMVENIPRKQVECRLYVERRTSEINKHRQRIDSMLDEIGRIEIQGEAYEVLEEIWRIQEDAMGVKRDLDAELASLRELRGKRIEIQNCPPEYITLGVDDVIKDTSNGILYTCKQIRVIPQGVCDDILRAIQMGILWKNEEIQLREEFDDEHGGFLDDRLVQKHDDIIKEAAIRLAPGSAFCINQFYAYIENEIYKREFVTVVHSALGGTLRIRMKRLAVRVEPEPDDW